MPPARAARRGASTSPRPASGRRTTPATPTHRYIRGHMARLAALNNAVRTLEESVARAKEAERLGYESVWVTQLPDARDAALVLAAYAAATQRVRLGTGVLPIYPRHPTA